MTISPTSTNQLYSLLSGGTQSSSTSPLLGLASPDTAASVTDPTQLLLGTSGSSQTSTLGNDLQTGNNSLGMMQIAEKTLSSLANDGKQLNAISTQLSNTSLNSDQQAQLKQQAASLTQTMQTTIDGSTFNGQSVFGNFSSSIGGVTLSTGVTAPDLSKIDVSNPQSISDFLKTVSDSQKTLGSQIVQTSNSMVSSINQSLFQSLDGTSSDNTNTSDFFDQSYQSMMALNAQSISQVHNTSLMQSSVSALLS